MLQYLVILLDRTSTSYCHYSNSNTEHQLISIENLKKGIFFGMKENLMIQFVYPGYELPQEYKDVVETIDHNKIMPSCIDTSDADIVVMSKLEEVADYHYDEKKAYVIRIDKNTLFSCRDLIKNIIGKVARLNIIITDIESFSNNDFDTYKKCLCDWADELTTLYINGNSPQFNLITDRMLLDKMNNCGAGDTTITLAPDGHFYICPAFYLDPQLEGTEQSLSEVCCKGFDLGSLENGLDIKNPQLFKISHAPLCRNCDAYHCKRCIWLNRRTTTEVNTPSHEQCVVAHLERNASRYLLESIRKHGVFLQGKVIEEISYLDPFDIRKDWIKKLIN